VSALLAGGAARRRIVAYVVLLTVSLLLVAISSNPLVRDLQNGVAFAFRPVQAAVDGVARDVSSIFATIAEIDRLRLENEALRSENDHLRAENAVARELQRQNDELVALLQRRALRIAFQYLRDAADADEAVQDAFVKVFTHITTYREDLPFEVWFTRILVNGCLDVQKARSRRLRWIVPAPASGDALPREPATPAPSPEERLLASECGRRISAAIQQLPERQRAVFTLCQISEQSTSEVSKMLGVSEATVRVHLFRAVRRLRRLLEHEPS